MMPIQMKTIGLIGGVSWVSTQEYYKRINQRINEMLGGYASAKIVMSSVNFEDILPSQLSGDTETETKIILAHALALQGAGADVILICSNTTNMMANEIQKHLNIPIINIVNAVAEYLTKKGISRVGLLGTKRVMYGSFYKKILVDHNWDLKVIVPAKEKGFEVDRIIYNELVRNIFKLESLWKIKRCIKEFVECGVEAVILGCTELPLLVMPQMVNTLLIDSIQVHIDKLFQYIEATSTMHEALSHVNSGELLLYS